MALSAQPEISTTGRTFTAPPWVRSGLRAADWVAPSLTDRLLQRMYFRPSQLKLRPEQREILSRGLRFELDLEGLPVVGWQWGQGARTVWLVHGWGGHLGQLTPFVDPLVALGFRVIGFDWPGHGASGGELSSLLHAQRALMRLEAFLGAPYGVVAHSFGAAATAVAMGHGLTVERLVFHAPVARLAPFIEGFASALQLTPSMQQRFISNAESWLTLPFAEFEPLRFTPELRAPLLVLHSRDDRDVVLREGERLADSWPLARLEIKEGLGHRRILQDPTCIARTVEFLHKGDRLD